MLRFIMCRMERNLQREDTLNKRRELQTRGKKEGNGYVGHISLVDHPFNKGVEIKLEEVVQAIESKPIILQMRTMRSRGEAFVPELQAGVGAGLPIPSLGPFRCCECCLTPPRPPPFPFPTEPWGLFCYCKNKMCIKYRHLLINTKIWKYSIYIAGKRYEWESFPFVRLGQ